MPGGGNNCIEQGLKQSYFFGFEKKSLVMERIVPFDGIGESGNWYQLPE
jgi:hypothetical protein